MEPGVATELVKRTVEKGKDIIDEVKRRGGVAGWAVGKAERPVVTVLDSGLGKGALNVAERFVKCADSNVLVKVGGNAAKGTSTAISKVYQGTLVMADRQVERFLPPSSDDYYEPEVVVTPILIVRKVTKRSTKLVRAAPKRARKVLFSAKNQVARTIEQARPANLAKNSKIVYALAITGADKLVDRLLPCDDALVATNPVTLTIKVAKRAGKGAGAAVRAAVRAVRNAPDTFKKTARRTYAIAVDQAKKVKARVIQISEMRKQARLPRIEDLESALVMVKARVVESVESVDAVLLRFKFTTFIRNMLVGNTKEKEAIEAERVAEMQRLNEELSDTQTRLAGASSGYIGAEQRASTLEDKVATLERERAALETKLKDEVARVESEASEAVMKISKEASDAKKRHAKEVESAGADAAKTVKAADEKAKEEARRADAAEEKATTAAEAAHNAANQAAAEIQALKRQVESLRSDANPGSPKP